MAESAFQKIIRVRNIDLAVLDESAYYETIYANSSVPNRRFYAIESPFRMNSQASVASKKMSVTNENKHKRKRKRGVSSNVCCDLREVGTVLKKILERAVAVGAFNKNQCEPTRCSSVEASLNFNNYLARQLAFITTSIPCPLSRYTKLQCIAKQNIKEIRLNEEKRCIILALDIRERMSEGNEPLKPHHIQLAYDQLREKGKLFPPYGSRLNPFI
ncbi:unnamed protein product [Acanthocheilonema viteae]|uniref:Uncharacterized protein n=1 Tax=Acanthocheilonema viteae TaxID=6277 RepID=A0A498SRK7_ACAVI|nr:unnamed protein product [Acanthocheilonema viteae]